MRFLFFHFKPKTSVWGGGGGGGGGEEKAAFRAPEILPLTEVGAAAVDDRFGPTSERGVDVDGRRRRCGLVPIGWLSFEFFPYVVTVFFPFPQIWKSILFVWYL